MLDLDFVRRQFPAFSEPSLEGQAFFENAGGSYTCAPVIERLERFYLQRKVQPTLHSLELSAGERAKVEKLLRSWIDEELRKAPGRAGK